MVATWVEMCRLRGGNITIRSTSYITRRAKSEWLVAEKGLPKFTGSSLFMFSRLVDAPRLALKHRKSHDNNIIMLQICKSISVSTHFAAKDQVVPEAKNKFYHFRGQFLSIRSQEVMDTKAFNDNPPLTANSSQQAIFFHLTATFTCFYFRHLLWDTKESLFLQSKHFMQFKQAQVTETNWQRYMNCVEKCR